MNEYDIKRLALVLAIQAEIEGMKYSNEEILHDGYAPKYKEDDFNHKAEELRILVSKHNQQI